MFVILKEFQTYAVHISHDVKDSIERSKKGRIAASGLHPPCIINHH